MNGFELFKDGKAADILIEKESFEGIKLIGSAVAGDIDKVTGVSPAIIENVEETDKGSPVILMATLGKSPLLERLSSEGHINLDDIRDRREVYKIACIDNPYSEGVAGKLLVIAGSDKRGTIYGMFRLSELCGVSPLVYWGDAEPVRKEEIVLNFDKAIVSKEPSVRYRGFFINDEWPAFGGWATEKFGDVNAKTYEKVFELLLRLKGNYMWPAMWNSSFSEDGPGLKNAELADKLGIIMGASHHEPMCRAGVEWQRQYKKYSDDNTWSFLSNEDGIRKFWEDGVKRNKDFENVITIGMRGEADSKLMPEDATLKDNIEVIKKAIRAQHEIIKENVCEDLKEVPRMLAIYKEVEDYYFGDEICEGLKDWDELKDVIFLLSDDNHGHVRALPEDDSAAIIKACSDKASGMADGEALTNLHPGGYGMYYHFDYHGAPISYEWVNCNRLTKTWEQMSMAYEAGVRKMWIVNVGDLKFNEYPLSFFMELAYDYEAWGENLIYSSEPCNAVDHSDKTGQHESFAGGSCDDHNSKMAKFVYKWIDTQFGDALTLTQKQDIFRVLEGYTRWNSARTPETMNENIYHPVNFMEGDRVWKDVSDILETAYKLDKELTGAALTAYRSMIFYPAAASLNLVLMNVEAGMNKELAKRGCVYANHYARSVMKRIEDDKRFVNEFHAFNGGKWNHMMDSAHTGFRSWDAYDWTYPTAAFVAPIHEAKALVSFRGNMRSDLGVHWMGRPPLRNDEFTRPDVREVLLDIDSRGDVGFSYKLETDCEFLICRNPEGKVQIGVLSSMLQNYSDDVDTEGEGRATLVFEIDRDKLSCMTEAKARVNITFDNGSSSSTELVFIVDTAALPCGNSVGTVAPTCDVMEKNVYAERQGICVVMAEHFCENSISEDCDASNPGFRVVPYLGKSGGAAIKAFPSIISYSEEDIKNRRSPYVSYNVFMEEAGTYSLDIHLPMTNPIVRGGRLKFGLSVNDGEAEILNSVGEGYFTDWQCREWGMSVLMHEHIASTKIKLNKGLNRLTIYAGDAGAVFEKLVIYSADHELPKSYFGPRESVKLS